MDIIASTILAATMRRAVDRPRDLREVMAKYPNEYPHVRGSVIVGLTCQTSHGLVPAAGLELPGCVVLYFREATPARDFIVATTYLDGVVENFRLPSPSPAAALEAAIIVAACMAVRGTVFSASEQTCH